jgi:IclR family KDG regulon transcriptional repressor
MSGTVEKAFKLLELLSQHDSPVRMAELSREARMNKSTVYRMLETMSQMGYVTQDEPNGRYMMTTRMWEIGVRTFQRNDLRLAARPFLQELVERTGETAILTQRHGADVLIIEKVDCAHSLQAVAPIGSRSPVHASSFGKAFLMTEPAGKVESLAGGFTRFTDQTITDAPRMIADLNVARSDGAAIGLNEYRDGVAGVAAPVIGADGMTHGTIGISLPSFRLTDDVRAKFIAAVSEAAKRFSQQIGHR